MLLGGKLALADVADRLLRPFHLELLCAVRWVPLPDRAWEDPRVFALKRLPCPVPQEFRESKLAFN